MASGDRIELLTAGTFEAAMNTQETILNNVSTNVNTINTNVAQSLYDISTAYTGLTKDISAIYQAETTNYGVLADLYNKIGATNNTGGTAAAGTMMAKLNTLINGINNLTSNTNNSLYSTVFIPSDNVLKTILSGAIAVSEDVLIGSFVAKHPGQVLIKMAGNIPTNNATVLRCCINNITQGSAPLYPSMTVPVNMLCYTNYYERSHNASVTQSTPTASLYIPVQAGDIVYFFLEANNPSAPGTITNVTVCGTTTSYY